MSMPHRLLLYLSLALAMLLPLEASVAATGCPPMASDSAMVGEADDCGGCDDSHGSECRSFCIALCQSIPTAHSADPAMPWVKAADHLSFDALPLLAASSGPEPPPPRLHR